MYPSSNHFSDKEAGLLLSTTHVFLKPHRLMPEYLLLQKTVYFTNSLIGFPHNEFRVLNTNM